MVTSVIIVVFVTEPSRERKASFGIAVINTHYIISWRCLGALGGYLVARSARAQLGHVLLVCKLYYLAKALLHIHSKKTRTSKTIKGSCMTTKNVGYFVSSVETHM